MHFLSRSLISYFNWTALRTPQLSTNNLNARHSITQIEQQGFGWFGNTTLLGDQTRQIIKCSPNFKAQVLCRSFFLFELPILLSVNAACCGFFPPSNCIPNTASFPSIDTLTGIDKKFISQRVICGPYPGFATLRLSPFDNCFVNEQYLIDSIPNNRTVQIMRT